MIETLTNGTTTEWTEVSRTTDNNGKPCGYTEGCPCCTCEEDSIVTVTFTRMRWSKSRKMHTPQTLVYTLCPSHMTEVGPW
jgi:hypothetical protein